MLETESVMVDHSNRSIFLSMMTYASSRVEFFLDSKMLRGNE